MTQWYSKEKNITMQDYYKSLESNNLPLKKIAPLNIKPQKGFVVIDTYAEDLVGDKLDLNNRIEHMGHCMNFNKELWRVYNKELIPIFKTIEEAHNFAEFLYGNIDRTITIHEVEIKIKPQVLDINGGREED